MSTASTTGGLGAALTFLAVLVMATVAAEAAQSSCRAVGGQSGQCVSIQNCGPLARLSRSGYVSSANEKQLLRESACGSELYQEKVCCPEHSISRTPDTEMGRESTAKPSDAKEDANGDGEDGDVSERRLFGFGSLIGNNPFGNPFGNSFGSSTTRRPFGDPFNSGFTTRRPFGDPFNSGFNSGFTTRRPFSDPFNNRPFNSDPFGDDPFGDSTTRRPGDRTTRRPNRDPFGSSEYTTRRPSRDPFGSSEYTTTRRPSRDPFGSSEYTTTRRPSRDPFGSSEYTTRRPSNGGGRTTTRRPSRDRTSTSRPGSSGGLVNPDDCGLVNSDDRIVGGNNTVVLELPWMVRLGYGSGRRVSYRCGGSLINNRYVLTAAHCVGGGEDPTQVRLGEHDSQSTEDCSTIDGARVCAPAVVDVVVEEVIRHPQFSDDSRSPNYLKNDIALLRLRNSVQFTEAVKPICLPDQGSSARLEGKKAAVAGWGKDKNKGSSGTRFLMKANVPVTSHSTCASAYRPRGISIEEQSQLCAGGERGVDSCQGDSGGPLYRPGEVAGQSGPRFVQYGVVSFGLQNCAVDGVPGVYTRVTNYMPWITSNMRP